MAILNGFTQATAQNLQLDAGVLVKDLTVGDALTLTNTLGATSGGATFTATPTYRNLFSDLDGARGEFKEGVVVDGWEISLSATVKETTIENLQLALGAVKKSTNAGTTKYDVLEPQLKVEESAFTKISWVGNLNGTDEYIIIELQNVLNSNGLNFTATDKGTGAIALELKAHFSINDPSVVPFKIYTPKA